MIISFKLQEEPLIILFYWIDNFVINLTLVEKNDMLLVFQYRAVIERVKNF